MIPAFYWITRLNLISGEKSQHLLFSDRNAAQGYNFRFDWRVYSASCLGHRRKFRTTWLSFSSLSCDPLFKLKDAKGKWFLHPFLTSLFSSSILLRVLAGVHLLMKLLTCTHSTSKDDFCSIKKKTILQLQRPLLIPRVELKIEMIHMEAIDGIFYTKATKHYATLHYRATENSISLCVPPPFLKCYEEHIGLQWDAHF